ncbi:MAG: pilus assembly protein [Chloroflexi bacterium]|nr:pilus assembly protein [Chloroflexota bacterium]
MTTTPTTPTERAPGASPKAPDALTGRRRKSRGQSLAEFALTVPFALLMVLFGLDFGRVFLGWVSLNNAAREAANYAAMNPTAWTVPFNYAVQAEYARLVTEEASSINCTLPAQVPAPSFASGTSIGAPAAVTLTCGFHLITPFIGLLTGNPIPVSAYSAFPVRAGLIEGIPVPTDTPSPAPSATTGPTASPSPSSSVAPTASPGASATASPTPAPTATPATCTVISLLNVQSNKASTNWKAAGFTGSVIFSPLVPPTYKIAWQSLTVGITLPCTSGITVRSRAP